MPTAAEFLSSRRPRSRQQMTADQFLSRRGVNRQLPSSVRPGTAQSFGAGIAPVTVDDVRPQPSSFATTENVPLRTPGTAAGLVGDLARAHPFVGPLGVGVLQGITGADVPTNPAAELSAAANQLTGQSEITSEDIGQVAGEIAGYIPAVKGVGLATRGGLQLLKPIARRATEGVLAGGLQELAQQGVRAGIGQETDFGSVPETAGMFGAFELALGGFGVAGQRIKALIAARKYAEASREYRRLHELVMRSGVKVADIPTAQQFDEFVALDPAAELRKAKIRYRLTQGLIERGGQRVRPIPEPQTHRGATEVTNIPEAHLKFVSGPKVKPTIKPTEVTDIAPEAPQAAKALEPLPFITRKPPHLEDLEASIAKGEVIDDLERIKKLTDTQLAFEAAYLQSKSKTPIHTRVIATMSREELEHIVSGGRIGKEISVPAEKPTVAKPVASPDDVTPGETHESYAQRFETEVQPLFEASSKAKTRAEKRALETQAETLEGAMGDELIEQQTKAMDRFESRAKAAGIKDSDAISQLREDFSFAISDEAAYAEQYSNKTLAQIGDELIANYKAAQKPSKEVKKRKPSYDQRLAEARAALERLSPSKEPATEVTFEKQKGAGGAALEQATIKLGPRQVPDKKIREIAPKARKKADPINQGDLLRPDKLAVGNLPQDQTSLFSVAGTAYGFEQDEDGDITFDPGKALLGLGLSAGAVIGSKNIFGSSKKARIRAAQEKFRTGEIMKEAEPAVKIARDSMKTEYIGQAAKNAEPLVDTDRLIDIASKLPGTMPDRIASAYRDVDKVRAKLQQAVAHGDYVRNNAPRGEKLKAYRDYRKNVIEPLQQELSDAQSKADVLPRSITQGISKVAGTWKDVYRNVTKVLGKDDADELILRPMDAQKRLYVDTLDKWQNELHDVIVRGMGIKQGSKLSGLVQQFGEKRLSYEAMLQAHGKPIADKVVAADKWFREVYNERIQELNEMFRHTFPDEPWRLIAKHRDYYRHFQLPGPITAFRELVGEEVTGFATSVPKYSKPKHRFLPFAKHRRGERAFVDDAVGGYLNYTESAALALAFDPFVAHLRKTTADLAKATKWFKVELDGKIVRQFPDQYKANAYARKVGAKVVEPTHNLDNFIEYLDDFGDQLIGKTSRLDLAVQKVVSEKALSVVNWLNNRAKANVIVGNASAAVAQVFNLPNAVGALKHHMALGASDAIGGLLVRIADPSKFAKSPMAQSQFLKERYFRSPLQRKLDVGPLKWPRIAASEVLGIFDEVATRWIWSSAYRSVKATSREEAVREADRITRGLVAGRGVGEVPLMYRSKVGQLVASFQIEVGNAWMVLGDRIKERDVQGLLYIMGANWLMNRGAEMTRGTPVTFDPIQAIVDGVRHWQYSDDPVEGSLKVAGRVVGEVASNVPLGQTAAAFVPEHYRKKYFGKKDPGRYGTGIPVAEGVKKSIQAFSDDQPDEAAVKAVTPLVTLFGGTQIRKTYEGAKALAQGEVSDDEGKERFKVGKSPEDIARALLFGPYGTEEGHQFLEESKLRDLRKDLIGSLAASHAEHNRITDEQEEIRKKWNEDYPKLAIKLVEYRAAGLKLRKERRK